MNSLEVFFFFSFYTGFAHSNKLCHIFIFIRSMGQGVPFGEAGERGNSFPCAVTGTETNQLGSSNLERHRNTATQREARQGGPRGRGQGETSVGEDCR